MHPQQPYSPAPQQPAPDYSFILNPEQPKRPGLFKFGGGSKAMRIAVVVAGIFMLLILLIGFKNLLAGSNKSLPSMVGVAQDQQELIHLSQNGVQNAVATDTKNFAVTAQASLASEQSQLITYLAANHRNVKPKELALKVSATTDAQLAASLSASDYDPTFKDIMKAKLATYKQDLQKTYSLTKGPKGRALLKDDYNAANLLLKQLGS